MIPAFSHKGYNMEDVTLEVTKLLVLLLGLVTSLIMGGLRTLSTGLDKLPRPVKAMVVAALAIPVAWLGGASGIDLPADPATWDGTIVNMILTWLSAMGLNGLYGAVTKPPANA